MNASLGVEIFAGQSFRDADGEPIALGYVVTKLAGLSTLQATYADATLASPNLNSATLASTLRLDAGGFPVSPMYFAPVPSVVEAVAYDVYLYDQNQVLVRTIQDLVVPVPSATGNATSVVIGFGEATTLTIAGGSITPIHNVHLVSPESGAADNLDNIAITDLPDGAVLTISNTNGSAPITIRNGVGNIFTGTGQSVVLANTSQRNQFIRRGANWYIVGAASAPSLGNNVVNGRLSVTSGSAVVQSGSGGNVYLVPFGGNAIDLYDGIATWTRVLFTQISIAVPAGSNKVYDVFCYNSAGTATLELSAAWTNATTRSEALTTQDGVLVKSGAVTRRYLGTVATEAASGVVSDTPTSRNCWNYYNRVKKVLSKLETTPTWSYNTATYRQANATATNQVAVTVGIQEDEIDLTVVGGAAITDAGDKCYVSIGTDSGTLLPLNTGITGQIGGTTAAGGYVMPQARLVAPTIVGYSTYIWLERGSAAGAITWFGTLASNLLTQTGISGSCNG